MQRERFECTVCGRCCFGMGKYVRVLGQMGPNRIAVRHDLSNETCYVTIAKEFRNDFDLAEAMGIKSGWCPFLRESGEGIYPCAIYETRPQFCRDFTCCRMRVYCSDGIPVARVTSKSSVLTDDEAFAEWWKKNAASYPGEGKEWEEGVTRLLSSEGYRVVWYD
jgi:Fe-S-cluster containining protein